MITYSKSKRTAKALPQVEATVSRRITAKLIEVAPDPQSRLSIVS